MGVESKLKPSNSSAFSPLVEGGVGFRALGFRDQMGNGFMLGFLGRGKNHKCNCHECPKP